MRMGETDSPTTWSPDSSKPITKLRDNCIKTVITKGRNPKHPGSRKLKLQCTEPEQSWEEAATSQTLLSRNHVTSHRLGVEPPLGLTARYMYEVYTFITHSSGAPSEQTVGLCSAVSQCVPVSVFTIFSVFQCQSSQSSVCSSVSLHNLYTTCKQQAFRYKLSVRGGGPKHVSRGPHKARQFILCDQLPELSSVIEGTRGFIFQEFLDCRDIYFITGLKAQKRSAVPE
jgi:hypothetical protein